MAHDVTIDVGRIFFRRRRWQQQQYEGRLQSRFPPTYHRTNLSGLGHRDRTRHAPILRPNARHVQLWERYREGTIREKLGPTRGGRAGYVSGHKVLYPPGVDPRGGGERHVVRVERPRLGGVEA